MPHVWTPLLSRRRLPGVRYVVIVHDADAHPGDRTGLVNRWLLRDAARADLVVTLSAHVARQLAERGFPEPTHPRPLPSRPRAVGDGR